MDVLYLEKLNKYIVKNSSVKEIIYQILPISNNFFGHYLNIIPQELIELVSSKITMKQMDLLDKQNVNTIYYPDYLEPNSPINPLISGYLKFNQCEIMPKKSTGMIWSEVETYQYFKHTPDVGINIHSWAINPLDSTQPSGSANLSKIDQFESVYELHPYINNNNPAKIITMVCNLNIIRYFAGLSGKAWIS